MTPQHSHHYSLKGEREPARSASHSVQESPSQSCYQSKDTYPISFLPLFRQTRAFKMCPFLCFISACLAAVILPHPAEEVGYRVVDKRKDATADSSVTSSQLPQQVGETMTLNRHPQQNLAVVAAGYEGFHSKKFSPSSKLIPLLSLPCP